MLFAVLAVLATAAPAPFTLDQVMSAPFPTGLVAARGQARVAWVMNARGVRNVWVAEGPDYRGRALTAFAEDDGEEIGELAFTADTQSVVFVRGGGPNRAGEIPNPWSRAEARERAVHVVTLAGATRRLADGHSPLPHPRENRIVFVDKNQVFALDLAEGGQAGAALRGARGTRLAALLGGRGFAGVRERPRRSRLRRGLRRGQEVDPLVGPRRRPRRRAGLLSRRQERRLPAAARPEGALRVRRGARGRTVVDPRGRGRERPQPRGLPCRQGPGQRLLRRGRTQPGALGSGRPPRVPLGEERLAASLFGARRGGSARRSHERRVRGRARLAGRLGSHGRLQRERGRHRPAPPLDGARERGHSDSPHQRRRHRVVAGDDERRCPRLLPLVGHAPRPPGCPAPRRRRRDARWPRAPSPPTFPRPPSSSPRR